MPSMMNNVNTIAGMEAAKYWVTEMLLTLAPVATWGIPRSAAIYEIHQREKKLIRLLPDHADESTEMVFAALGYSIQDRPTKEAQ